MAAGKKDVSPAFLDPSFAPWVLVSEVYWMSFKFLERRLYHLGISGSQARVLAVLHSTGEPTKPSTLAMVLLQESQTLTGILQRVERRGWVERTPDPADGRAVRLRLTDSGRKLAEEIDGISRELYEDLFVGALGAAERKAVAEMLKKVRAKGFNLPETDFRLRKARQYTIWSD